MIPETRNIFTILLCQRIRLIYELNVYLQSISTSPLNDAIHKFVFQNLT